MGKNKEIIDNFNNHFNSIKEQLASDSKELTDEDGNLSINKENDNLEEKYADLIKEIEEKSELMDK
jgi:hypothetical protein